MWPRTARPTTCCACVAGAPCGSDTPVKAAHPSVDGLFDCDTRGNVKLTGRHTGGLLSAALIALWRSSDGYTSVLYMIEGAKNRKQLRQPCNGEHEYLRLQVRYNVSSSNGASVALGVHHRRHHVQVRDRATPPFPAAELTPSPTAQLLLEPLHTTPPRIPPPCTAAVPSRRPGLSSNGSNRQFL